VKTDHEEITNDLAFHSLILRVCLLKNTPFGTNEAVFRNPSGKCSAFSESKKE
jgi:hypothetical protein